MASQGYIGLVASDGEDVFRRIVCSGGPTSVQAGVIAVGFSTHPRSIFKAVTADLGASSILYGSTAYTSLSVGYDGGYWMIVISK